MYKMASKPKVSVVIPVYNFADGACAQPSSKDWSMGGALGSASDLRCRTFYKAVALFTVPSPKGADFKVGAINRTRRQHEDNW